MDFSDALKHMKAGRRIKRSGWNGRDMFVYLATQLIVGSVVIDEQRESIKLEPCIMMRTAQGKIQPGWLASQMDLLANDWEIV